MSRARVGIINQFKKIYSLLLIIFFCGLMASCASSDVTRDVTANIDTGVQNTSDMADGFTERHFADSYQNATQRSKGALVGGSAGAVTGSIAGGIGAIPGAAVGALFGASYGSYIDQHTTLDDQLKNRGINIVMLGDQILIVIPSARLFKPYTSTLKTDSYSTFRHIASFINSYNKMLVKVSAHTAALGSSDVNYSLSQAQAESVSKMLQASGVDARVLYAMGYGGTHLVQRQSQAWEGNDNYRIEITLEKLYV